LKVQNTKITQPTSKDEIVQAMAQNIRIRNLSNKHIQIVQLQQHSTADAKKKQLSVNVAESIFGKGTTQIEVDAQILSQLWSIGINAQKPSAANTGKESLSAQDVEGQMALQCDYTHGYKNVSLCIKEFVNNNQKSQTQDFTKAKKVDGSNTCTYAVRYFMRGSPLKVIGSEQSEAQANDAS
jgi:hypothetical protein